MKKLKVKKIIFTNGSLAHAKNVTKRLGIERHFDDIFDIVCADFIPKPSLETYKKIIEKYKIEPQYSIFIEDIARNLKPAHELGMKTVWIINEEPWAAEFSDSNFIDYKTDKLSKFLKEINDTSELEKIINKAFDNKQNINEKSDAEILKAIIKQLNLLIKVN